MIWPGFSSPMIVAVVLRAELCWLRAEPQFSIPSEQRQNLLVGWFMRIGSDWAAFHGLVYLLSGTYSGKRKSFGKPSNEGWRAGIACAPAQARSSGCAPGWKARFEYFKHVQVAIAQGTVLKKHPFAVKQLFAQEHAQCFVVICDYIVGCSSVGKSFSNIIQDTMIGRGSANLFFSINI